MDKAEFIRTAPQYYTLAVISFLIRHQGAVVTRDALIEGYKVHDVELGKEVYHLWKDKLLQIAISWLEQEGMIEIITDSFGPPLFVATPDFFDKVVELEKDRGFPFYKYKLIHDGEAWLLQALAAVNQSYRDLGITGDDFDQPDKDWEPLPLERDDPQLLKVIEAVGDTAEKVRSDNGYAANLPEERDYVLESLSALSRKLSTASTISYSYLKQYAFRPLRTLLSRFGGTAIGLAASLAKEALRQWLLRKGITFLDDLF